MPAEQRIEQHFGLLNTWRTFPNYQLERRADIFFALYAAEILRKPYPKNTFDLIIPEFPLRLGTIRKDVENKSANRSVKVDYACIDTRNAKCVFLELKTDDGSTRDVQYSDMELAADMAFATLLEGMGALRKKSRRKDKYDALFAVMESKGLVNASGTNRNDHQVAPTALADRMTTSLAIIKPVDDLSAERKKKYDVITFDAVRQALQPLTSNDPVAKHFHAALGIWRAGQ